MHLSLKHGSTNCVLQHFLLNFVVAMNEKVLCLVKPPHMMKEMKTGGRDSDGCGKKTEKC